MINKCVSIIIIHVLFKDVRPQQWHSKGITTTAFLKKLPANKSPGNTQFRALLVV